MLRLDDGAYLDFSNMGLFIGGEDWIHPTVANATYELIFLVGGVAYLEEEGRRYVLHPGDLLCLRPGVLHGGYRKSSGTVFFWLHFFAGNYTRFGVDYKKVSDTYHVAALMKKLNHLAMTQADRALIESMLLAFLLEMKHADGRENKLFHDVREYIRTQVETAPKVCEIAARFGYNADHLSRLFKKNSGWSLKQYIDRERTAWVSDRLLNTAMTLKEIAAAGGFENDNALIKFFSVRVGCSPTQYRNRHFATHTNRK